jgi:hypothetical protein
MKLFLVIASLALGSVAGLRTDVSMMARRGGGRAAAIPKSKPATRKSEALPWSTTTLDGTLVGDVGFDPFGLSTNPEYMPFEGIKWYREAELQHGRVAMLAFTGFIAPSIIGTLPGDASHNFGELNPLNALTAVPQWGLVQIIIVIGGLEGQRYLKCVAGDNAAGDVGLGQGGFNPFNLNYSPAEYEEKQLQEIKHCRLAMLGVLGAWWQNILSGKGVLQQIGDSFSFPTFDAKAGYYFPDGL